MGGLKAHVPHTIAVKPHSVWECLAQAGLGGGACDFPVATTLLVQVPKTPSLGPSAHDARPWAAGIVLKGLWGSEVVVGGETGVKTVSKL